MRPEEAYSVGYLVDQVLRRLAVTAPAVARTFRAPLGTAALVSHAGLVGSDHKLADMTAWWFRLHDGQAVGAPAMHAARRWRALSAAEAMAAQPEAGVVPLFVDDAGHIVSFAGEGRPLVS